MSHHRAIATVFAIHGAVAGSMSTRIPWLQGNLELTPETLGLVLLCQPIGAFIAMPMAARLAYRISGRTATRLLIALWSAAVALPALAPSPAWLFPAFFLFGAAAGMSDVVMNAHAVVLERRLGRSIMSGLHGMWAVGSLTAGGIGALAAQAGIDARLHLAAIALLLLAIGGLAGRDLYADGRFGRATASTNGLSGRATASMNGTSGRATAGADSVPGDTQAADAPAPRRFALPTLAILPIGLVGFCATFAEGASANWAAVYLTAVTEAGPGVAAAGYTVFMFCMAGTRLIGDRFIRRLGPVRAVRAGGVVAVLGGVIVVLARTPALGIAGFALVGLGLAIVVPLVLAMAGNVGATPGEGVSGVATITYLSGMISPPVTGWLAGGLSYPAAFGVITGVVVAMTLLAGVLRPAANTFPQAPAEYRERGNFVES
ncbi:MFS transporter [Nonomuraea sp. NPDC050404]|uniref:MFS transporter n=1 Tax=Nonomuraea sp. NPDC050404 TaxID=3155783 RepID=UPI003409BA62